MSLWTPYSDDEALDLSGKTVKGRPIPHHEPPVTSTIPYPGPDTSLYTNSPLVSPSCSAGSKSPDERAPRPFKMAACSLMIDETLGADPEFEAFRESMLCMMRARNGGAQCVSNPRMRRAVRRSERSPDAQYLERRERNNAAAKRSRDLRKIREDELAIRAAYLQRCNDRLRAMLQATRAELDALRANISTARCEL